MIGLTLAMATLFFLLASGFYSGTEMGVYCVNRVRLRLRFEQHPDVISRSLHRLMQRRDETVLAILLGTNLANYLLTVAASEWLTRAGGIKPHEVAYYAAAILSPAVFVLGDVVPKNWFRIDADRLMYRAAPLLHLTVILCRYTGLLAVLRWMTSLSSRLAGYDKDSALRGARGEIIGLLREGAAEGGMTEQQSQFIENVMNLSSVRVGSIMVPYRRVVTLPLHADRDTLERIIRSHNFSRLPVVSRHLRSVAGIGNIIDVLYGELDKPIDTYMHPPLTIPASESASAALVRMRQARETMAVVTDPRRGFVGIITLKDIVEEIFGELPEW